MHINVVIAEVSFFFCMAAVLLDQQQQELDWK